VLSHIVVPLSPRKNPSADIIPAALTRYSRQERPFLCLPFHSPSRLHLFTFHSCQSFPTSCSSLWSPSSLQPTRVERTCSDLVLCFCSAPRLTGIIGSSRLSLLPDPYRTVNRTSLVTRSVRGTRHCHVLTYRQDVTNRD
jgi:hypothetical protein